MRMLTAYLFDMRVCKCLYRTDRQFIYMKRNKNEMMKYMPQTHTSTKINSTYEPTVIKNTHYCNAKERESETSDVK